MKYTFRVLVAIVAIAILPGASAWSQSFEVVHRFGNAQNLPNPALIQGADGFFYGTTAAGGDFNGGTVFRMNSSGAVTVLYSFTQGSDGYQPTGGLIQATDGLFYGATAEGGGESGGGTLFRISAAGAFQTIFTFPGPDGVVPNTPMLQLLQANDGLIYGATGNLVPTIFRIDPTTLVYENLHTFDQATEGGEPTALIQASDGYFYGTLAKQFGGGGPADAGAIFRMDTAGNVTILHSFTAGPTSIFHPVTALVEKDGYFYGLAANAGDQPGSAFYRMDLSGNVTVLQISTSLSQSPYSYYYIQMPALALDADGYFYGSSDNSIFKLDSTGALTVLYEFDYWSPNHNLGLTLASDGFLYGSDSGPSLGSVYRVSTSGAFQQLHVFVIEDGAFPGPLVRGADGFLYGTTGSGGQHEGGTVYRLNAGGDVTVIHSFAAGEGGGGNGALILGTDNRLYGTTYNGGESGNGSVFRVSTAGVFETLHSFDGTDGAYPPATALLQGGDGYYYGTTQEGGDFGVGTVFRMASNGHVDVLHHFEETDGSNPNSALVLGTDDLFYGTTRGGGDNGLGTVFSMNTAGVVTVLHSFFQDPETGFGSWFPNGVIQASDGWLYGTTVEGGDENSDGSNGGSIFRIHPNGTFETLQYFNTDDGLYPTGTLIQAPDGLFYGVTTSGNWNGTLFRFKRNEGVTVLKSFGENDDQTGADPVGPLVRGLDGLYYGTTVNGGGGLVYRVNLFSETPPGNDIVVQPVDPVTGTAPVNITFGEVVSPGETTVAVTVAPPVPPPANFNLGSTPTYFDVSTTATFAGDIQVCFDYTNVGLANPAAASLLHFNGTAWIDVTTSNNVATHTICGVVDSLSPFVIGNAIGEGPTLVSVGEAHAWLGLKNSDDQGTRFDVQAEIYHGTTLVTSGLTRCIVGVVKNPNQALESLVQFAAFDSVSVESGDALRLKLSTRIGTNPNGTKCAGHNSAAGLRLYYDVATRPSRIGAELSPASMTDEFLHTISGTNLLTDQLPTGAAKFLDSAAVNFAGGNLWKTVGEWTMTVP